MEIEFKEYKYNDNNLNFTIKGQEMNGILGKDYRDLVNIISLRKKISGEVLINKEKVQKENILKYIKKISTVPFEFKYNFFCETIYDLMINEIKRKNIKLKDSNKKIRDSLKIVGLEETYLNRKLNSLSSSEQKLVQLALSLISNPEVIIIEDIFKYLDKNYEKKIIMLLQKIKEQYSKTIILTSETSEELYKYTTNLIIYKNNKILATGNTYEIMQRVDFLKKNRISIPKIVEFTYLVKKNKHIKIDYHKDVRDIIKDIYKHV